uniref:Serum response factor-binding protein 1 n=2 Tax=Sphaeramia orbicularis TaxID=375764 RepID=A0A673A9Q7_9TELE
MIKMATPADEEQEKKIDLKEEVEAKQETEEEIGESDEEEESGDDEDDDDGEAEDGADEKDDKKEEEKATPTPRQAVKAKKKQDDVLNLNNEVVKMRKDMKRVRALIIRKLISQIAALKKKKGKEMEVERNQRRAARLLEEIHAMKILVPDLVTKTALQKSLNFDQVCKNPKSTISDRAIARIATHPQFNKKIEQIKAAVKAFKEERMKGEKQRGKVQGQNQVEKSKLQSEGSDGKKGQTKEEKDEDIEKANVDKLSIEDKGNANVSADTVDVQEKKTPETETIKPASIKNCEVLETVRSKPQSVAAETKPNLKSVPEVIQKKDVEAESDLESSSEEEEDGEEKEYFDDSTEERFHKQSSGSESDDDDFFLGKVSKFKKKKTSGGVVQQTQEVKGETTSPLKTSDPVQSELDELESRLKSKATSLKSVFCSSLSGTKQSRGGGGGRGGNKFSKQRGGRDGNRDFSKQSKFQNQDKSKEGLKYNKPCPEDRRPDSEERGFASAGRGRGRGRGRG